MKKIIFSIIILLTSFPVFSNNLVLFLYDGSAVAFEMSKVPEISFNNTDLIINCEGKQVFFTQSEVVGFTYVDKYQDAAIVNVNFPNNDVRGSITDGVLYLSNVDAGAKINIYDMKGVNRLSYTCSSSGEFSIPFNCGNEKMFIVSINGNSFKIMKK